MQPATHMNEPDPGTVTRSGQTKAVRTRRAALMRLAALGGGIAVVGGLNAGIGHTTAGSPVILGELNDADGAMTTIRSKGEAPALTIDNPGTLAGTGNGWALHSKGHVGIEGGRLSVFGVNARLSVESEGGAITARTLSKGAKSPTIRAENEALEPAVEAVSERADAFGIAIHARGDLALYPSAGVAIVEPGKVAVDVTLPKRMLGEESLILATVQGASGRCVRYTQRINGRRFRIALDAVSGGSTKVGYLIVRGLKGP